MKKIINILLVLLVAAGMTFAQSNKSTVDITGDLQDADVLQLGNSNTSAVEMTNVNTTVGAQSAMVRQDGAGNSAKVQMDVVGAVTHGPNSAYIEQVGNQNVSVQFMESRNGQGGNDFYGKQEGHRNSLLQKTDPAGFELDVRSETYGSDNEVRQILQGNDIIAKVGQDGNANTAKQELRGHHLGKVNPVLIWQEGNGNTATQTLAGGNYAYATEAEIYQEGNGNTATQIGDGLGYDMYALQDGNANTAYQSVIGDMSDATIETFGSDNFAKQLIDGDESSAYLHQDGNSNWSLTDMTGDYNHAEVRQLSNGNWSKEVVVGDNNTINVYQD